MLLNQPLFYNNTICVTEKERGKKRPVDKDSDVEFFFRKSELPQKHTIGNVIFESISILPEGEDLTSLTDVVVGITLTTKTLSTLVSKPSSSSETQCECCQGLRGKRAEVL